MRAAGFKFSIYERLPVAAAVLLLRSWNTWVDVDMATRNLEDVYPLSPLQEGILFHSLYAPESGVYVEQLSCALVGPLDAAAFARAWERVIERHAVLRTAFVWKSQKRPLQAVQREVALPLSSEDWSQLAAGEREARLLAGASKPSSELREVICALSVVLICVVQLYFVGGRVVQPGDEARVGGNENPAGLQALPNRSFV